jgi:hypothetical protein
VEGAFVTAYGRVLGIVNAERLVVAIFIRSATANHVEVLNIGEIAAI